MTQFEFLSVALSFVLGLAITVLLSSLLIAFRARRKTRMNWLPLIWAFVLLLVIVLLLFVAGGLVLPTQLENYPEDLGEYFQQDGRWAVAVVGLFQATAIIVNTALFDVDVLGLMNIWNAVAIAITVVVVSTKRRVIQGAATIAFGVWLSTYIWVFVPSTY